LNSCIIPFANR